MKKKIFIIVLICFICIGCGKSNDTSMIKGASKDNKFVTDYLLGNVIDNNLRSSKYQFYIFSEDGKFVYKYSTEVQARRAKAPLIVKGTWTLNENNLTLKQEEIVFQAVDSVTSEYTTEYAKVDNVIEYKNVELSKLENGTQYLKSDTGSLHKKETYSKEYVKKIKYYLDHDIKDIDVKELQKMEAK